MNKKYITLIVLVLIIGGMFLFGSIKKSEAPAINDNQTDKMQGAIIPVDYNVPVKPVSAPVKEFVVTGQNFSFTPSKLSVKKGDLVKITFKNAEGFHDFRIDEFKIATPQIKTGEESSVEFVADKTGSFQFYCSVGAHRTMGMWGTLTVE